MESNISEVRGVGIDIGGTTIKAALVRDDGSISRVVRRHTPQHKSRNDVLDLIAEMILEQAANAEGSELVVGIGTPGYGGETGYVIGGAHNLPDWFEFNLAKEISERIRYPVFINNDASMAAYGEYAQYYNGHIKNMVFLGLGTGVGGGMILGGKLYSGYLGLGTEFGHVCVEPGGLDCVCGRKGCLQMYASKKGLVRSARHQILESMVSTPFSVAFSASGDQLNPVEIFSFIKQGDPIAVQVFDSLCTALARACDTIATIIAPEVIVLGGGIMNDGKLILPRVREKFKPLCMADFWPHIRIEAAQSGENSGVIGAALYAISQYTGA